MSKYPNTVSTPFSSSREDPFFHSNSKLEGLLDEGMVTGVAPEFGKDFVLDAVREAFNPNNSLVVIRGLFDRDSPLKDGGSSFPSGYVSLGRLGIDEKIILESVPNLSKAADLAEGFIGRATGLEVSSRLDSGLVPQHSDTLTHFDNPAVTMVMTIDLSGACDGDFDSPGTLFGAHTIHRRLFTGNGSPARKARRYKHQARYGVNHRKLKRTTAEKLRIGDPSIVKLSHGDAVITVAGVLHGARKIRERRAAVSLQQDIRTSDGFGEFGRSKLFDSK